MILNILFLSLFSTVVGKRNRPIFACGEEITQVEESPDVVSDKKVKKLINLALAFAPWLIGEN